MSSHRARGLTLIELLVVTTITVILLMVAIGGFGGMFARKRVEGLAADFVTDLQQARTEAVARNRAVRVTFGNGCYVLHTTAAAITCNGSVIAPPADPATIRAVVRPASDATFTLQPAATPPGFIEFSPVNGTVTSGGIANPGALIGSAAGPWRLLVTVNGMGRVEICSTSLSGYVACP